MHVFTVFTLLFLLGILLIFISTIKNFDRRKLTSTLFLIACRKPKRFLDQVFMSGITTLVTTPLIKDFYKTEICVQICSIPINTLMHNVEMFFGKSVLKICSRFTKEHPCRSVISLKLLCTSAWVLSCKFAAYFQNSFSWEHLQFYIWTANKWVMKEVN